MRRPILILLVVAVVLPLRAGTVTMLHFSDYHSHALPFYSEGRNGQGGIARAIGFLREQRRRGALVFSGGDMFNKAAPTWSDAYGCAEWPWLNDVVDAMAFGNHEGDYGFATFVRCRAMARFPLLSANVVGFQDAAVFERDGIRIGVFAVAGPDFRDLVKVPELEFEPPLEAARRIVRDLREVRKADVIVMIGHEDAADDYRLAAAVPGIDVIFGSHTHLKQPLTRIAGTRTWFISPSQYLTYISRVRLRFDRHKRLTGVTGELVRVDRQMSADRRVERRVAVMQGALERDPRYRARFVPFARLTRAVDVESLARMTLEAMRDVTGADLALSTTSSFRQALPPGPLSQETFTAAMPYENEIVVVELPPDRAEELLRVAEGSGDARAFVSGRLPQDGRTVRIATTDFVARTAAAYHESLSGAVVRTTGRHVRQEVRRMIEKVFPEP